MIWDSGELSLASRDERGILQLRRASNHEAEESLAYLKGAAEMPSGLADMPTTHSPSLSPTDAAALLRELEWHEK